MKIRILRENKKDCFQEEDFDAKSSRVKKQGASDSNAYVAKVLRDKGELKDVEELEEMSAAGAGGAPGPAGSIGNPEDIRRYNEEEKRKSKLDELFSSSGTMGGIKIRFTDGIKQHAGHVERSQHQGLRNVMEDEEDDEKAEDTFKFDPEDEEYLFSPDEQEEIDDDATGAVQGQWASVEKTAASDLSNLETDKVFILIKQNTLPGIINSYGFEKLYQAALNDPSTKSRIEKMVEFSQLRPLPNLSNALSSGDKLEINRELEEDLEKYYGFLALEFWFITLYRSGWDVQGFGETDPERGGSAKKYYPKLPGHQKKAKRNMLMAYLETYVRTNGKKSPAYYSAGWKDAAEEYELDKDFRSSSLYHLPQE